MQGTLVFDAYAIFEESDFNKLVSTEIGEALDFKNALSCYHSAKIKYSQFVAETERNARAGKKKGDIRFSLKNGDEINLSKQEYETVIESLKELEANFSSDCIKEMVNTFMSSFRKSPIKNDIKMYALVTEILPVISDALYVLLSSPNNKNKSFFTELFQKYGNHIRAFGGLGYVHNEAAQLEKLEKMDLNEENNFFTIAEIANSFIKLLRNPAPGVYKRPVRVVVDSIKNVFEGMYLRDRYSAFYLFSVSKDEKDRKSGLAGSDYVTLEQRDLNERPSEARKKYKIYKALLEKNIFDKDALYTPGLQAEGLSKNAYDFCKYLHKSVLLKYMYDHDLCQFYLQDVEACIQNADIHIFNAPAEEDKGRYNLKWTVVRYASLIMHPGLVLPTPAEACMQIANTAKASSGCISRQVGAVVTDSDYNILSIGWNDVSCRDVSCCRRSLVDVKKYYDGNTYSNYELGKSSDQGFRLYLNRWDLSNADAVTEHLSGLPAAYCFKDIQEKVTGESNQVHTRARHAEENAIHNCDKERALDGYLFTTSSPCELCAKTAKATGIKKVYYIAPYPGISEDHIFMSGDVESRAQYELFVGAIGRAYSQLFSPILPLKDELLLRGIKRYLESGEDDK